jgi:hypothetical protein
LGKNKVGNMKIFKNMGWPNKIINNSKKKSYKKCLA